MSRLMPFDYTLKYSNEGAPMLIGDISSAKHWAGREYDGSGVIVSYWGQQLETLPKEFALTTKKGGERQKTFATIEEATAFEQDLLEQLKRLHPTAAKPPKYPNYPAYYVGAARVFGIERQFTSQFDTVGKKLKGDVTSVPFDKKHKSAALFLDTHGGGPGVIAVDQSGAAFIVAAITTLKSDDDSALMTALAATAPSKLKRLGQMKFGSGIVVFDSSLSASTLARLNWGANDFASGASKAIEDQPYGPIRVPDQQPAGGAFLRMEPGVYSFAVANAKRGADHAYNALWLWRS
jgi:hypothetical protein